MSHIARIALSVLTAFYIVAPQSPTCAADPSPLPKPPSSNPQSPFPLPTPTASYDVNTLHVDQYGTDPRQPLLLIPGLASGPWAFHDTIARLAPTHTLYALTLPGFDGHPANTKSPLFLTVTNDIWTLLSTHHIDHPVLIGHSLGGTLAISLAEQHPDRLAAIIAIDGLPVFPMLAFSTPQQRTTAATQMAQSIATLSPAQFLASQKSYMAAIGTNHPTLVDPIATHTARSDPKATAAWLQETLTTDLRPNLPKITIPLLELMPYNPDPANPYTQPQTLAFYQSLLATTPHATVTPITPARHFLMLDQPEAFHTALTQFLAQLNPTPK